MRKISYDLLLIGRYIFVREVVSFFFFLCKVLVRSITCYTICCTNVFVSIIKFTRETMGRFDTTIKQMKIVHDTNCNAVVNLLFKMAQAKITDYCVYVRSMQIALILSATSLSRFEIKFHSNQVLVQKFLLCFVSGRSSNKNVSY